ncbi:hypothetical protein PMIN04_001006 [Paraphaeosphaeria minitans]
MKLSVLVLSTSLSASARPDFSLAGFARNNPLGATTGGAGGETVTVTTLAALKSAIADTTPRTIYLTGNFTLTERLSIGPNKSVIGTGPGANILANGFNIKSVSNVIIRNLGIRGITGNDGITIQNSTRVWIDHNEFESGGFPANGPDAYDGQCDIIRASDWITVSWNYFHDHWKSSLVGNGDALRDVDHNHLHVTYHHNYWRNEGTRGPAGRFGHQHVYNNLYEDFLFQAIHSRSDNQVLVEGNVFRGDTREALSTYGLVIPDDSPNTSPDGDYELDGFANLGAKNDWGPASINITRVGNFTEAPYKYALTALGDVEKTVKASAGLGKI